jgi:hypothetical protein
LTIECWTAALASLAAVGKGPIGVDVDQSSGLPVTLVRPPRPKALPTDPPATPTPDGLGFAISDGIDIGIVGQDVARRIRPTVAFAMPLASSSRSCIRYGNWVVVRTLNG